MRRVVPALLLAAAVGCAPLTRAAAPQQDAAKIVQPSPATAAQVTPVETTTQAPAPAAPGESRRARTQPVHVPDGTRVELEMAHTIDSQTTRRGDPISFRVVNPVVVDGEVVIAVGATATAVVTKAERNGHFGRAGRLRWEMREVTAVDGSRVPLQAPGRAVGDSKGAKAATLAALSILSPFALPAAGFKRGENAVVPEGKRYEAVVQSAPPASAPRPQPAGSGSAMKR